MRPKRRHSLGLLVALLFLPLVCQAEIGPDAPFQVHSRQESGRLTAAVSGTLDFPFDQVSAALTTPEAWCAFIPLIFNVKACTFTRTEGRILLTFYVARNFRDPPAQAYRLRYRFDVRKDDAEGARIRLFAPRGPHGTRNYILDLEIRPAGDHQTELRFDSSFRPSLRSRLATRIYLSGAGQDKVGFSVERYEGERPVYVRGVKGVIERNAMRHYLALEAFLETLHLPEEKRFEASLHAWYEATEEYPRQLYEMNKEAYLAGKRRERAAQEKMQDRVDAAQGSEPVSPARKLIR